MKSKMSNQEFHDLLARSGRTSNSMRRALQAILVFGSTWRAAAHRHDVSESGIMRAMRRLNLAEAQKNCQSSLSD